MAKTVYLSEQGDDKNDGLTDETPVRTAAKAVKTSIKFGAQGICVLGRGAILERLNAELAEEGDETLTAPSLTGADKLKVFGSAFQWAHPLTEVSGRDLRT